MLQLGEVCHGFRLTRQETVAEIQAQAQFFRHEVTGAEVLCFGCDDDNKVFLISFRTPPTDDTGVAHILEHSVLAGSCHYPVKEPFLEMLKGSLSTFLNAFTYPDRTVYPVASRNAQDFHNLMDVYLDAVFNPLLRLETFRQEGWHYELAEPAAELQYVGVVYNEMLGAYSTPESLLMEDLHRGLFPQSVYGRDSGGDPAHIPDLTYEQFVSFHQRYYHPSNSRIVLYGDLDVADRLAHLARFLDRYQPLAVDSQVAPQPRLTAPVQRVLRYPISSGEDAQDKTYFARGWLLGAPTDAEYFLSRSLLSQVLVGTAAAPLNKALIDSHLGEDLVGCGLEQDILDTYFSAGLRGTNAERAPAIEALIDDTLRRLAEQGLEAKTIEAAVNTVEFSLREANFGGYPKGLVYGLEALIPWLYGADPLMHLRYEATLRRIRSRIAGGRYFEELIRTDLLTNPHRVTVVATPDATLEEQRRAALRAELAAIKERWSPAEVDEVVQLGRELKAAQEQPNSPEALATIPRLPLSCVRREAEDYHFAVLEEGRPRLSFSEQKTNGIIYLQAMFDASRLPAEFLPWLPLFGSLTLQAGTTRRDYVDLTEEIGVHTGGVHSGYSCGVVNGQPDTINSHLTYSAKALCAKAGRLAELLAEIITSCDWANRQRIAEVITMTRSGMRSAIIPHGHGFAVTRLAAYHSRVGQYAELTRGLSQYRFLEDVERRLATAPETVLATFRAIAEQLFVRDALHVHVTGSREELAAWQAASPTLVARLPSRTAAAVPYALAPLTPNEGFTMPAKIQYVGLGTNLFRLGFHHHGTFEVLSKYLSRDYLWGRVRVQGGAYGCFCGLDPLSGNFHCCSYRDPRLAETLAVYREIAAHLRELTMSDDEFEKLVIGTIGAVDMPRTPDQRGAIALNRWLSRLPFADIQARRDELLACRLADVKAYAGLFEQVAAQASICVFGAEEQVQRHAALFQTVQPAFAD